jgi:hypothetical protein
LFADLDKSDCIGSSKDVDHALAERVRYTKFSAPNLECFGKLSSKSVQFTNAIALRRMYRKLSRNTWSLALNGMVAGKLNRQFGKGFDHSEIHGEFGLASRHQFKSHIQLLALDVTKNNSVDCTGILNLDCIVI